MGNQYKEQGGGPATGLANSLTSFLGGGLSGQFGGGSAMGQFDGSNPMGATQGMAGVLNDLLSGGAGRVGGAMQDMISKSTDRQANELRARYGSQGGMSMGTPAAYAESMMRAQQAPQLIQSIGGLQMGALMPLMQMMTGLASKGISQREGYMSPSPWTQAAQIGAPMIGSILGGPMGGMIGDKLGGMFGGGSGLTLPNVAMPGTGFGGFNIPDVKF